MTGYTDCACRDCFEIAIGEAGEAMCHGCVDAGCYADGDETTKGHPGYAECQREDAYGMDGYCQEHGNAVCKVCPSVE